MHNVLLRSQDIPWSCCIVDVTALDSIRKWLVLSRGRLHLIAIYHRTVRIAIVVVTWIYVIIADVLRGYYCCRCVVVADNRLITVVIWRPIDLRLRLICNTNRVVVVVWRILKWMWRCCWSWFNDCRLQRRRRRRRIHFVSRNRLLLLPSLITYCNTTTNTNVIIIIILLRIIPSIIIVVVIVVGDLRDNSTSRPLHNLSTRFRRINVRNIIIVVAILIDLILIRIRWRNLRNIQLLLLLLHSRLILRSRRWSYPTNIITIRIITTISYWIPSYPIISIPTTCCIFNSILTNPFNPPRTCANYPIRLLQFLLQYLFLLIFLIIMINIINRLCFLVIRFG